MDKTHQILEVLDTNGKLVKIEVLKYLTLNENGKDYIIYRFCDKRLGMHIYAEEVKVLGDNVSLLEIKNSYVKHQLTKIINNLIESKEVCL